MAALLERAEQAVSVTNMVRSFSARLKEISSGVTDRLVIFKDNEPAAVMVSVEAYQELMDELENLRIEAIARERLNTFDKTKAISLSDMKARYAAKE